MSTREHAPSPEAEAAPEAAPAVRLGDPTGILALQRTIGNAAVGRLLQRQVTATTEGAAPPAGSDGWTEDEIRAIQREIRRLRLYDITIDGILGRGTDQGLTEAFGATQWRKMSATEVHERLRHGRAARRRRRPALRSAELFTDGVLDVTFGIGFIEAAATAQPDERHRRARCGPRSRSAATRSTPAAPPSCSPPPAGRWPAPPPARFYVKENAFTYSPPAGESRQIHSIVRVVYNDVPGERRRRRRRRSARA